MVKIDNKLAYVLSQVRKPARYMGNEWNAVHRDHKQVRVKMVLGFPDLYEVGMSNQGIKILYDCVNRDLEAVMERVFAPAVDMEELMRQYNIPLFALESGKPVKDFDLIGFSLQYELSYSNVLNMLDLGNIPLYSTERRNDDPLVIGGGPCVYNPEPLAPFFDLFILGEAEEALPELLSLMADLKGSNFSRKQIIKELSLVDGVYVPSFYSPRWSNGKQEGLDITESKAPTLIKRRLIKNLDQAPYPVSPLVPYIQTIHDRAVIEIFRGCARGCRFCQAGFTFRPVRRRSREKIVQQAKELLVSTGYEELSLSSLSSSDYPHLDRLLEELEEAVKGKQVKISLPSLRLDSYSIKLADRLHQGRRSNLTFAPEAATERLRKVINKDITEDDIFTALSDAVDAGWQGFKLYFMIGLPTETRADVEAIAALCERIQNHFKNKGKRGVSISVSVSTFVPKAQTPFQWEPQIPLEEIIEKQEIIRRGFKHLPGQKLSWHQAETSLLEAVFARGDRNLALVLEKAWRLGCRFDGWSEYFSYDRWQQAFSECGVNAATYAQQRFAVDQFLPWGHLQSSISIDLFCRENQKSMAAD